MVFTMKKFKKKLFSRGWQTDSPKEDSTVVTSEVVVEPRIVARTNELLGHMNNMDVEGIMALFHPDIDVRLKENPMRGEDVVAQWQALSASFTECDFRQTTPTKLTDPKTTEVNIRFSGTHTGAPFGFGPYPAIEAKGIKCVNDPETFVFHWEDEKVVRWDLIPKGEKTGPIGLYVQIGGYPGA